MIPYATSYWTKLQLVYMFYWYGYLWNVWLLFSCCFWTLNCNLQMPFFILISNSTIEFYYFDSRVQFFVYLHLSFRGSRSLVFSGSKGHLSALFFFFLISSNSFFFPFISVRLSESLYTVKGVGENGSRVDELKRLISTASESSCLPASFHDTKKIDMVQKPHVRYSRSDPKNSLGSMLSGHTLYIDSDISDELRNKVIFKYPD